VASSGAWLLLLDASEPASHGNPRFISLFPESFPGVTYVDQQRQTYGDSRGASMNMRRVLSLAVVLCFCAAVAHASDGLSADDVAKIKQVHKRYEETWLKGDANGVRSLFTEDCVLFPPHADTPRIGLKGMNESWFPPDAPPTQNHEISRDTAEYRR
jgi:hypothetical protein